MTPRSTQDPEVLALLQSGALLGCSGQEGAECDPVPSRALRASRSCPGREVGAAPEHLAAVRAEASLRSGTGQGSKSPFHLPLAPEPSDPEFGTQTRTLHRLPRGQEDLLSLLG